MNIRRFRLWVLFAAACLIGAGFGIFVAIVDDHIYTRNYRIDTADGPIDELSSYESWSSYGNTHSRLEGPYKLTVYAHKSIPQTQLNSRLIDFYGAMAEVRKQERFIAARNQILVSLAAGTGIPAIVLAIGAAFAWALSGFKRT